MRGSFNMAISRANCAPKEIACTSGYQAFPCTFPEDDGHPLMVLVVISSEVYNRLSCIGSEYFRDPVHLLSIILRICRFSSLMLLDKALWSYSLSSHSKILSWSILVSDLVLRTVSIYLSAFTNVIHMSILR